MHVKESFLKLYDEKIDEIFQFSLNRTANPELAKSITTDTFIKAWDFVALGYSVEDVKGLLEDIAFSSIQENTKPLRSHKFVPSLKVS